MKILIVTPYFYPKVGGLENYALNIAKGLKKSGHEVLIVTSNHESSNRVEERIEGLRVIRLPRMLKLSNTPINPMWYFHIKAIIRKERPDVVNAHTPVPFIADMTERVRGNVPFVLTYHNDLVKETRLANLLAKIYNFTFTRKTIRKSDSIIATSEYYSTGSPYLKKWKDKTKIVSPGIDTERFNSNVDKNWLREKYPGKKIVLFVGSLEKTHMHKGVDILIKASAGIRKKIPNIQLLLAGEGDAIPLYKSLAREFGVNDMITFTGFIKDKDLPLYYAGADVFVLPSTTDAEGYGMVLIEALACGTPVIGSAVGGIPFVLKKIDKAKIIKPGSVTSLRNSLTGVLTRKIAKTKSQNIADDRSYHWFYKVIDTDRILKDRTFPNLIHISAFYPPYLGGMEFVAEQLSIRMSQLGYCVTVITSIIGTKYTKKTISIESNYRVERLKGYVVANQPFIPGLFLRLVKSPRRSIFHIHISQAFIPEIVLLAAKIRGIPVIAHFHLDVAPSGRFGLIFRLYKKTVFPLTLRLSDRVVVFSKEQKKEVINKYNIAPNSVAVIPNGVSNDFYYESNRKVHAKLRILFVGRLTYQKNVKQLLYSLEGISDEFHTLIVGDGILGQDLRAMAKELKLTNVEFKGRVDGSRLIDYYKNSDVFVLTSEREGMPLVLLEALAMKLPIIATDVTGNRELISRENGLLVPLNDLPALKEALLHINSDHNLYKKLSEGAGKLANQYRWDNVIDQFQTLYREAMK